MTVRFSLREMRTEDSAAVATLIQQSPDGGNVQFSPRYHIPVFEAFRARHGDMVGVVAEAEGTTGVVGAAHVSFGQMCLEEMLYPYALLSSLVVHPDYRRQGIGSALAMWRMERATQHSGNNTVIIAAIQNGNAGSIANAQKWATQMSTPFVTSPVPMRDKAPAPLDGVTVRRATTADLDAIAEHLNTFYEAYNVYQPQSAETLRIWLEATPLATPIHHYFVATDATGRLLAGIGLTEEARIMSLHIEKMSPLIQIANLLLKVVPADREMRNLQTDKLWFAPGALTAARHLWQTLRWEWREQGSSLISNFDPRSPLRDVLQTPPWSPTTSVRFALRAPVPLDPSRLIEPLA